MHLLGWEQMLSNLGDQPGMRCCPLVKEDEEQSNEGEHAANGNSGNA